MQGSRVFLCLLLLVMMASPHAWCRRHHHDHDHEKLSKAKRYLNRHNKPAVLTIQSPDGDTIDCVPLSKQPAFDHPMLKDHKIQMEPSVYPAGHVSPKEAAEGSYSERNMHQQLWHEVQEKCPSGTIPIRRTTEDALLRAKSIKSYGRKFHQAPSPVVRDGILNENAHQHAIAYVQGGNFFGAKATMNVWEPSIEVPNEFSLSQLWILAGSFDGNLNSIEAGWQVNPDLYGDNNTRLFTYWTSDAYQATGCYNLLCSGFIQVSDEIALGATISPVSNYDGVQYEINILVWKDPNDGNWWMQFGDKYVLGYWPGALFSYLSESSSMVEWGGEVVNSGVNGRHTATHMGSGHFPNEGFGKSSYIANIQVVDSHNNLRPPPSYLLNTYSEQPNCYRVQQGYNSEWGYYFFYGGPGYSSICT